MPERRSLLAASVLIIWAGCTQPLVFENRRPFFPPMDLYTHWWEELEACTGLNRDMGGIRWYLADRIGDGTGLNEPRGQWTSEREITFKAGHELKFLVVKHEMLHDILNFPLKLDGGNHQHEAWGWCDRQTSRP